MSTCLITGGAGNLASQLSQVLADRHDHLILIDIAAAPRERLPENATYERADLSDEAQVGEAIGKHRPNVIVHLASLLSGSTEQDRTRGWRVNADSTFFLLESALKHGVEKFLFTSSVASFGGELPDPLPEEAPQWPDGLYGVTKMACERLGVYYHRRHGLDFRCLRLPITISPLANPGAASAFASLAFIESARFGRYTFRVREETPLALIYVQDAVAAMASLLTAPGERLTRRVYNLHAMTVTPRDIADSILRILPATKISFAPDPAMASLIASWPGAMDDSRARSDWGWTPQFDMNRTADHILQEILRERPRQLETTSAGAQTR
jgi:threonine 3-dehydrogenase